MLKNPDFLVIPYPLIEDKRLTPTDRLLYGAIYWLERLRDGKCTASNRTLAEICAIASEGTAANGLGRLEKCGYITRIMNGETRVEIRTNVSYAIAVSSMVNNPMNHASLSDEPNGSLNDEQNNNKTIRKENKKATASVATPTKVKLEDNAPMTRQEFIDWCKGPKAAKHIQIIAEWAEAEGPEYTTAGQWRAFIGRNVRVAKRLEPFTLEQIEQAYEKMMLDVKSERNPRGFITKYSLETLEKYL